MIIVSDGYKDDYCIAYYYNSVNEIQSNRTQSVRFAFLFQEAPCKLSTPRFNTTNV